VVGYPWLTRNLCHEIFIPNKQKGIYGRLFAYFAITTVSAAITYGICSLIHISLLLTIIVRAILCVIIPNIVFVLVYRNTTDFQETLVFVNEKFLKGRFKKIVNLLRKA